MIRIPNSFNSTFITRHFFKEHFNNKTFSQINSGKCYDWAYFAHRIFPDVTIWSSDFHAWVEVDGRFYDSETRHGVSDFMKLACNRRLTFKKGRHVTVPPWDDNEPSVMSLCEFKNLWNCIGAGRRYHWDTVLEKQLKSVLGSKYSEVTPIIGIT